MGYAPSGHLPTGVNHRTTTQGFPRAPLARRRDTSERPASRPIAGVLPPVPRFSIAHCVFIYLMRLITELSSLDV